MTTPMNPDHPTPARVAELRSRHPDRLLIFRIDDTHYVAYEPDDATVKKLIGGGRHGLAVFSGNRPRTWCMFPTKSLEPLLSALIADGRRAAVVERATTAPGQVERVVTPTEGDRS